MDADQPTGARRYPLGVLVVIAIAVVRGATIVLDLSGVTLGGAFEWVTSARPLPEFTPGSDADLIARVVLTGILATSVLIVVGLVLRRRWAWILAIVTSGFILAIDIGSWLGAAPHHVSMLMNVIAVMFLNQRDVQAAMRGGEVDEP